MGSETVPSGAEALANATPTSNDASVYVVDATTTLTEYNALRRMVKLTASCETNICASVVRGIILRMVQARRFQGDKGRQGVDPTADGQRCLLQSSPGDN